MHTDINSYFSEPPSYGQSVSNAIFHLDRPKHPFMEYTINQFPDTFNGGWASGGPVLLTKALNYMCGTQLEPGDTESKTGGKVWGFLNPFNHSPEKCQGVTLLPPQSFYPIPWYQVNFREKFEKKIYISSILF